MLGDIYRWNLLKTRPSIIGDQILGRFLQFCGHHHGSCEGLAPAVIQELFIIFDQLRQELPILIVEHNLNLVLALADRVFALEHGAVFHEGEAKALLDDLDYRKEILWL